MEEEELEGKVGFFQSFLGALSWESKNLHKQVAFQLDERF